MTMGVKKRKKTNRERGIRNHPVPHALREGVHDSFKSGLNKEQKELTGGHNRHSHSCEQGSRVDAGGRVGNESNRTEQQEKEIDGAVLESRFASQFLLPESEPILAFHVLLFPINKRNPRIGSLLYFGIR